MKTRSSDIRGRKPIHNYSPTGPLDSSGTQSDDVSTEKEDTENEFSEDDTIIEKVAPSKEHINQSPPILIKILYTLMALSLLLALLSTYSYVNTAVPSIENLQKQFPFQAEDFWISVRVAVEEINRKNQPQSIIFLHANEKHIDKMLESISEYAALEIRSNVTKPLILKGEELNKYNYLKDYGTFITEVREKLNDNIVVVIVKNLDQMPGMVAQAFHSLCDEYNPIVERVLYIFTLRVDYFPKKQMNFVEKRLREQWSDLHSDKFYALFTRISAFVLPVH